MRGTTGGTVDERNNWRNSGCEEQLEEQWMKFKECWMRGTIGGTLNKRNI